MKNLRLFSLVAAALLGISGGIAIAAGTVTLPLVTSLNITDEIQIIKSGVPSLPNVYATGLQLRNFILSGNSQVGVAPPVISSCGTGSPSIIGTNSAGTITTGTSATACTATFATAYVTAPVCNVTSQTAYATTTPAYTVSATAIVIAQTSTSGNKYDYICVAQPGG